MNAHKMTPIAIIVGCLALAGCASTGATTSTAAQPPQPPIPSTTTISPTGMVIIVTAPRPTQAPDRPTQVEPPTPVDTPVPTSTSYPAPAVPLSPTGPWLVFQADNYLWAINQDGIGLTRLTTEPVMAYAVQPTSSIQSGLTIAYITKRDDENDDSYGIPIKLLSWPSEDVKTIAYNNVPKQCILDTPLCNIWSAYQWGSVGMVWSPSGHKLAFVGIMGESSTNVFVYDTITEQTTRIAVTNGDDYRLRWSPDERYVIFETHFIDPMVNHTNGVWSARADAGGVTQLVGRVEGQWIDTVKYLGWSSSTDLIVTFEQSMIVGGNARWNRDIRLLNIETGSYTIPVSEPLLDVAYSPEHNLFLMTKEVAPSPSRLLTFYQNGERREVAGYTIKEVDWLSAYDVFLGRTPDGRAYLITPDGAVTEVSTPEWSTYDPRSTNSHSVIVSPDRQWWAWHAFVTYGSSELWVGPAMSQASVSLSYSRAVPDYRVYFGDVIWSPDSQYLLWTSRQGIFVAKPPDFEAVLVTKSPGNWLDHNYDAPDFSGAVWVQ